MTGNATSKNSIKLRKNEDLTKEDRGAIKRCLIQYMVENDMKAEDLGSTDELFSDLLPMLAEEHLDWKDIAHVRELKESLVRKSTLDTLRYYKNAGK